MFPEDDWWELSDVFKFSSVLQGPFKLRCSNWKVGDKRSVLGIPTTFQLHVENFQSVGHAKMSTILFRNHFGCFGWKNVYILMKTYWIHPSFCNFWMPSMTRDIAWVTKLVIFNAWMSKPVLLEGMVVGFYCKALVLQWVWCQLIAHIPCWILIWNMSHWVVLIQNTKKWRVFRGWWCKFGKTSPSLFFSETCVNSCVIIKDVCLLNHCVGVFDFESDIEGYLCWNDALPWRQLDSFVHHWKKRQKKTWQ